MDIVGVDIGGTKCTVVKAGESGEVLDSLRFETTGFAETYGRLLDTAGELAGTGEVVFGVTCGGPISSANGVILSPPNLPGWDEVPVVDDLRKRFGSQAWLMNDADAGALAEWKFGAARGASNVVFLTHGTGNGAGLILNGRLHEGASGAAGEIGHVRLTDSGPVGFGKAGSFEGWTSGGGIGRLAQMRLRDAARDIGFGGVAVDDVTAKEVAEAARSGDELAAEIFRDSSRQLGRGLALLVDVLNPEVIVLGSMYQRCRDLIEPEMRKALEAEALPGPVAACRIVAGELGDRISEVAPVAVALYRMEATQ